MNDAWEAAGHAGEHAALMVNATEQKSLVKGWAYAIGQTGVSKNNGTPKSSILIGFSIINHPFWDTPIFGNTEIHAKKHSIQNQTAEKLPTVMKVDMITMMFSPANLLPTRKFQMTKDFVSQVS